MSCYASSGECPPMVMVVLPGVVLEPLLQLVVLQQPRQQRRQHLIAAKTTTMAGRQAGRPVARQSVGRPSGAGRLWVGWVEPGTWSSVMAVKSRPEEEERTAAGGGGAVTDVLLVVGRCDEEAEGEAGREGGVRSCEWLLLLLDDTKEGGGGNAVPCCCCCPAAAAAWWSAQVGVSCRGASLEGCRGLLEGGCRGMGHTRLGLEGWLLLVGGQEREGSRG